MIDRPAPRKELSTAQQLALETLRAELATRSAREERLLALVRRQDEALSQTLEHPGAAGAREFEEAWRQNAALVDLLERALAALDGSRPLEAAHEPNDAVPRLTTLLDRALAGTERLERELAEREAALEQVLALSERSLAAATTQADASKKVRFWRRMFGEGRNRGRERMAQGR